MLGTKRRLVLRLECETLLPLIDETDEENAVRLATNEINAFPAVYERYWLAGMRAKLGLAGDSDTHLELVNTLLGKLEGQDVDFTRLLRRLADAARGDADGLRELFSTEAVINEWLDQWLSVLEKEGHGLEICAAKMDSVNPVYIPRNHKVEEALNAATSGGDLKPFERLLDVLARPFDKREGLQEFEEPAPADFGNFQTYCGT